MAGMTQQQMPNLVYSRPTSGGKDAEFSKFLVTVEDIIQSLQHCLRGEQYEQQKDGRFAWIKKGDIIVGDKTLGELITIVRGHLDKVSLFSNLDETEVYRVCREVGIELSIMFYLNWDNLQIQNGYRRQVIKLTTRKIFYGLKSAQAGGLRDSISKQVKETFNKITTEGGQKVMPQIFGGQQR